MCILVRHAESMYNVTGRVNGDSARHVPLSPRGVQQARLLATQLAGIEIAACVHSDFNRTLDTAREALAGRRQTAFIEEPLLGDVRCGVGEGRPVHEDDAWRGCHRRHDAPDGGESVREAARRISHGVRAVVTRTEPVVAVFTHEVVVRYVLNAVAGGEDLSAPVREVPNAMPFLFGGDVLLRAADRIGEIAAGRWGDAVPGPDTRGG